MQERADIGKLNQAIDDLAIEADTAKSTLAGAVRSLDESIETGRGFLDQAARASATLEEATDGLKEWMVSFGGTADLILATERDVLDSHDAFHRKSLEASEELREALVASTAKVEEGQDGLYAKMAQDIELASRSLRADVVQARGELAHRIDKALQSMEDLGVEVARLEEESAKAAKSTRGLRVLVGILVGLVAIDLAASVAGLLL